MVLEGKIYKLDKASSQLIFNKKDIDDDTINKLREIKILEIKYDDMVMKLFTKVYEDTYHLRFRIAKAYAEWFNFKIANAECEVKDNMLIVSVNGGDER